MSDATQEPTEQPEIEQPAPEAEEAASAEEKPAEGAEAAAEEGKEGAAETEEAKAEKHRRAGGWQRKIEKLERERELLLEQLAAQRGGQPQPARPDKEKTADEKAAEYVNSLVEKRLAAERAAQQQAEAMAAFQARTQEVRAAHPDFDDVVQAAGDAYVSDAVKEAILTSENGPRIMYQLATNPAELARISALPPLAAAREVGRLEAKLASSTAAPAKPTPAVAPRKSAAPAPITPVTSRGPSAVKDPSSMSYEQYAAWRNGGGR